MSKMLPGFANVSVTDKLEANKNEINKGNKQNMLKNKNRLLLLWLQLNVEEPLTGGGGSFSWQLWHLHGSVYGADSLSGASAQALNQFEVLLVTLLETL